MLRRELVVHEPVGTWVLSDRRHSAPVLIKTLRLREGEQPDTAVKSHPRAKCNRVPEQLRTDGIIPRGAAGHPYAKYVESLGLDRRRQKAEIARLLADLSFADLDYRADDLLRTFDEKLRILSDFPGAGPARPELRPRLRSFPVGNYLLFYRPTRGGIELLRVLHGARDLRKAIKRGQ